MRPNLIFRIHSGYRSDFQSESVSVPLNFTHRKNSGLLIEVNGVHDDEDLLVFVGEPGVGLLERGLAVVLHPAVLAEEGGGQP